jgi:tetratricopeptide (TPR) repeat protein
VAIRELMTDPAMGRYEWSQMAPPLRKAFYDRATNYYRSLLQEDASDPSLQYETAVGYRSLAYLHEGALEYAQAEKCSRQSVAILKKLSRESPEVADYRHQLGYSLFGLAQILAQTNRPEECEAAHRRSLAIYEKLCIEQPNVADYPEMLLKVSRYSGEALLSRNRFQEAEQAFRRAIEVYAEWQTRLPDGMDDAERSLAALTRLLELRSRNSTSEKPLEAGGGESNALDAKFLNELELAPASWDSRQISSMEKTLLAWAKRVSRPLKNGDFSAGLHGWTVEGSGAFGVYSTPTGPAFTTYGAHQDADTGRIYQCFKVPEDATALRFQMFGGSDEKKRYVALWQEELVWQHATAHNDNTPFEVQWDLTPLRGEVVTLEIVDHDREPYGFISAQHFLIVRP